MNDRAVMERLAADNMGLAYTIAYKYGNCGLEAADLESAAMFGLAKAAMSYDPSRGIRFSSFAARCMKNEIGMELRKAKKHMGQLSLEAERFTAEDERHAATLKHIIPYEDPGFEHADNSDLIPSLLSGLPEKESQAIQLVVCSELTQMEAAERMGICNTYVSRCIKSGLAKIRKKYMEGESEWERTKR